MEIAMVSVTTVLTFKGDECEKAVIVLGAVAPTFIHSDDAEAALKSRKPIRAIRPPASSKP